MQVPIHCSNSWYVIARKANAKQMSTSVKSSTTSALIFVGVKIQEYEEKLIESDHEGSDESENKESKVPDDKSILLTDSDYDNYFWIDNYYGL